MEDFKVLLVDDEEDFLESLNERLKLRKVNAETAKSGEEALERIQDDEPTVIVLDLKMPGMHGLEVLKRLKATNPDVQVVTYDDILAHARRRRVTILGNPAQEVISSAGDGVYEWCRESGVSVCSASMKVSLRCTVRAECQRIGCKTTRRETSWRFARKARICPQRKTQLDTSEFPGLRFLRRAGPPLARSGGQGGPDGHQRIGNTHSVTSRHSIPTKCRSTRSRL